MKILLIVIVILTLIFIYYYPIIKHWYHIKNNLGLYQFLDIFVAAYRKGTLDFIVYLDNQPLDLVDNFLTFDNNYVDKKLDYVIKNDEKYYKINYQKYKNNKGIYLNLDYPIYEMINKVNIRENDLETNTKIPKIIWQTFYKKINENDKLYPSVQSWKNLKDYEYNFLDDTDGEKFIEKYYDQETLNAYRSLIPGAFKADLLRVCLIYQFGGIYADIKIMLNYHLDYFIDRDLVIVRDGGALRIWNGFFAAIPKHPYLKRVLNRIVHNVNNRKYGINNMDITGPTVWFTVFVETYKKFLYKYDLTDDYRVMQFLSFPEFNSVSRDGNFEPYLSFDAEYKKSYKLENKKDYSDLWLDRKVFN